MLTSSTSKIETSAYGRLVLASASPRRAELLRAAGIPFDVDPAHVDETVRAGETAEAYVQRVAEAKAWAAHSKAPNRVVLAADTTVVVDDRILGKPENERDARRMLELLSGRSHAVMTGVTVIAPSASPAAATRGAALDTRIDITTVTFAPLTSAEIDWYVASGESTDKAGGYAVQGLASRFVTRVEGSYSNVVGLPVALVYQMLRKVSISC